MPSPPDFSELRWQTLNPATLAEGTSMARAGIDVIDDFWSNVMKPAAQTSLQLTRLMAQLVTGAAAPQLPGVQDMLQEVVESLTGFLSSGVLLTVHHNVKANPRFKPGAMPPAGQVLNEPLITLSGMGARFTLRLAHRPRPGSLNITLPSGVVLQDEDGAIVGTGVASGTVDYAGRRIVVEMTSPPSAGGVTASYSRRGIPTQAERDATLPWTGGGVDNFMNSLIRTFPSTVMKQSVSGVIILGGTQAPDEFGDLLGLLGRLFGKETFIRMKGSFDRLGESVADSGENLFGSPGAYRFQDAASVGPPYWHPFTLDRAFPQIGDLYRGAMQIIEKMVPPPEVASSTDVVLCALEEKIATFQAVMDRIDSAMDTVRALSEAAGANIYVLPLLEQDSAAIPVPLGASATGSVIGGDSSTGVFAEAVGRALWPVEPGNPDAGYSSIPPASLRGDAFVAGAALVALTGQVTEMPTVSSGLPTPMQLLSALFGVDQVQSAQTFGSTVRELESRPPTAIAIPAP